MATLSVLGSLMSQLGSTAMPQYDPLDVARQQNLVQGGRVNNQTALLQLQELQRAQASAAQQRQFYQQHPEFLLGGGAALAQSPLASLGAGGPMTQTTTRPGDALMGTPGGATTQQVPAYPDLSQFATGQAPQSTLGALNQPQGNPLWALAQRDPEAAQAIYQRQQQMEEWRQQQDLNRLTMGLKVAEFVANEFQGVTDQTSLDQARERVARVHPQAAAALPQWYTKEGVAAVVQRGQTAAENAKTRLAEAQTRLAEAKVGTEELQQQYQRTELRGDEGQPADGGAAPTLPATQGTAAGSMPQAPAAIEGYIDEAHRLYPQVPRDLIRATMLQESYFNPNAKGSAGEIGLMQLKPGTAKDMGVDPHDPRQNVLGGTRYLAQQLRTYGGDERRALAAYNQGPGRIPTTGDIPEAGQRYADAVMGHRRPAGGTPTPPATSAQVAALDRQIAAKNRRAEKATVFGQEGLATQLRSEVQDLRQQRNRLEDQAIAERHREEPSKARIAEQEAGRALAPIEKGMVDSISTNKSIYGSIEKMEKLMSEGTDLPPNLVDLVAQDAPEIQRMLEADPKEWTGLFRQYETKLRAASGNDPRINRFLSALANMRDLVIFERSGGSVTGNELSRATGAFTGSLPDVKQAFSLFMQNMANVKELVTDRLTTMAASVRPLSGGKAVFGGMPKAIRDRVQAYEEGREPPQAQMPARQPKVVRVTPVP